MEILTYYIIYVIDTKCAIPREVVEMIVIFLLLQNALTVEGAAAIAKALEELLDRDKISLVINGPGGYVLLAGTQIGLTYEVVAQVLLEAGFQTRPVSGLRERDTRYPGHVDVLLEINLQ